MNKTFCQLKHFFYVSGAFLILNLQGCSIILPSHNNSYDITDEKVTLRMIKKGGLCDIQKELNPNSTKENPGSILIGSNGNACASRNEFAFLAPIAAAGVGLAVDFVKKQIQDEATHYEAQFGDRIPGQRFWTVDAAKNVKPYYDGFEIIRETSDHKLSESAKPAFRMIFAFDTSSDGAFFLIKPTYFFDKSAKAKVLSKASIASWFDWFTKATGGVDVKIDIDIDAIWTDEKKQTHNEKIAAFPISIGTINLDSQKELSASDLVSKQGGWFPGVPCSSTSKMDYEGKECGEFWIKVLVTEKDPSNAKKYLEQAAELVGSKKETVVNLVTSNLNGK